MGGENEKRMRRECAEKEKRLIRQWQGRREWEESGQKGNGKRVRRESEKRE